MSPAPVTTARPSAAFSAASWFALLAGMGGFLVGLWNATMALNRVTSYCLSRVCVKLNKKNVMLSLSKHLYRFIQAIQRSGRDASTSSA